MAKRKEPTISKAPEAIVAGQLAAIYGVPRSDLFQEVFDNIVEHNGILVMPWAADRSTVLYPWTADVCAQVMSDKPGHMIDELMVDNTQVLLVKDTALPAKEGLWYVSCGDPSPMFLAPYRGVSNHHRMGSQWVKITAIQVNSCLR
jgi:hypothetical protein